MRSTIRDGDGPSTGQQTVQWAGSSWVAAVQPSQHAGYRP